MDFYSYKNIAYCVNLTGRVNKSDTCKVPEVVQRGNNRRAPPLQEEQHHDSKWEVGDPGPGDATGDGVSSGPTAHSEHQMTHSRI